MRLVLPILATLLLQACGGGGSNTEEPAAPVVQQTEVQPTTPTNTTTNDYSCDDADHPNVGKLAVLTTHSHNVAGQVLIKDNCTLEVTSFSYDGEGPSVYFYGGKNGQFASDQGGLIIGEALNGTVFNNETLELKLASPVVIDEIDSISVWCDDFNVSFGDGEFI